MHIVILISNIIYMIGFYPTVAFVRDLRRDHSIPEDDAGFLIHLLIGLLMLSVVATALEIIKILGLI